MNDKMTPRELAKRIARGEKWKLAEPDQELAGLPDTAPEALRRFRAAITGHALTVGEKGAVLVVLDKCADELERLARENAELRKSRDDAVDEREGLRLRANAAEGELAHFEDELAALKRKIAEAPTAVVTNNGDIYCHLYADPGMDLADLDERRVALLPVGGE